MIPIEDPRVEAAINGSHVMVPRVTAFYGAEQVGEVTVASGDVTFDESNPVQGRCSVRIPVGNRVVSTVFDPRNLDVSGWRLFIEYGVVIRGVRYYVPLGTFVCYDMSDDDDRGRTITITGYETTVLLRDGRFELPYQVVAGSNYATALGDLATAVNLPSNFPVTGFTTPLLLFVEGDDRLAKMNDMATSVGWHIAADPYGVITGQPDVIPNPTNTVLDFIEGDGSRMTALSKRRTRQQAYNIAVVTGEPAGATAPVYGVARDDDATSNTYYLGPFGRVPVFLKSQFVTTTDQANAAAYALLARKKGIGSALRITTWPHPGVRPGDPVSVLRTSMGVNQLVPIKSVRISLTPGDDMILETREGLAA